MSLPAIKISPRIAQLRIRENHWDQLGRVIDDIVLDRDYEIDVTEFLKWLQASLTKRQGFINEFSQEHQNIQQDVNIIETLILCMNREYERDNVIDRAEKLEKLKIAVSKLQVVT